MRPLDLDDLAALQADLDLLDERDLITELAPGTVRPAQTGHRRVGSPDPAASAPAGAAPGRPPGPPHRAAAAGRTHPRRRLGRRATSRRAPADVRPAGSRPPVPPPARARPATAGRGLLSWALGEAPW